MAWHTITSPGTSTSSTFFGDWANEVSNLFSGLTVADSVDINTDWQMRDTHFTIVNTTTTSKKAKWDLSGATAAKTLTLVSSHTNDRTITFPDSTATLLAGTQKKTIRVPIELRTPQQSSNQGNVFWNVNALTAYDAGNIEFTKAVTGNVFGYVRVPNNLDGSPACKVIVSYMINATSGNVIVNVSWKNFANGATGNPSSLTSIGAVTEAVPGTAYFRDDISFTLASQPAADDILIIQINYSSSSTANANMILLGAVLECVVDTT